ncbi:MAG TPA: acetyl-CoA C-acetyltransferase [Hyphomicrobiaceae bacterium]|nr:acetyl-CoA C-acetyltransferase [Hyphomicrobiaceae bacterium]
MEQTLRPVAVLGGVRIPFCRSNTLYADQSNLAMLTATLNGLVDKYDLKGVHIDEAIGGAVVTHSRDWNLAREAVLGSKLAPSTPGITLQQACGTSLQAAMILQAKIATGEIECGIAMGADTTSDAPIVFKEKFAHRLVEAQTAKSFGQRLAAFKGFSPAELAPQPPSVSEPRTGLSMGQHTELMAQEWHISRAEQDRLAFDSHRNAAEAYRSGFLDDLVVPFAGVFRDNNLREDISLERLATLKPAFDKSDRGTLTAANSTPLTDGAAAVLLASPEWAARRALPVQAYLTYAQTAANNFVAGEGLLLAPAAAVARMLARAQLKLQDFDFYEIHEAFAAQVLVTLRAFEDPAYCKTVLGLDAPLGSIDRNKLNVKGSSLAFGHPFAATGARILATLAKLLAEHGGRGLISVCTAGGMGVAAILENKTAAAIKAAA